MRIFKQQGFSLIELVVAMTVISLVMTGTIAYITNSVTAYTATTRRNQLTTLGRTAIEQVARDLRAVLPNSLRVSNNCIEFFPTLGGSSYLTLPTDNAANSFTAVDFTLTTNSSGTAYVVVYPYNTSALYSVGSIGPLAGYSSKTGSPTTTVTLTASHQFDKPGAQRRFYVVAQPESYCIVGTDLLRYRDYGVSAVQSAPPAGNGVLVAQNIQTVDGTTVTPFSYSPGTLRRSGVVTLDFRFLIDGEWIRLSHEVHVQNVL